MHILMWINIRKAIRRTYRRPPVYFFNFECDPEISTEIDTFNNFPAVWFGCVY
jgi:hypothetical protein